jgi:hypothetical protein
MLGESKNQFSLTRGALSTCGRQKAISYQLLRPTATEAVLAINANVRGAGGELYAAYAKGESLDTKPPKPVFTLTDGSGKRVASGNLDFG